MFELKDRVAIVTGSGSKKGIGRTIALTLAKQGAAVVVADLNADGIQDTVQTIQSEGGKALGVELNVTSKESVDAMVETVLNEYGRIDILVNNAGISQKVTVEDMTVEDMAKVFNVNMFGLFLCTQAVLEPMKKQKFGRVVSLSSVSAKRGGGVFGGAHYSASKAAVLGFSKNLAREVAREGITVNCVAPGLVNTEIWKSLPKEDADNVIAGIPMGRPGETEEIASTIAFLASEEASYITGEEIDINGGSHMD
ncbi:SDR family NAD(P)-dependent oxidoreductase [Priestia filamentosa]|uniref:glucose 1-dehydrogenase [NAD(P)(+)] n=1 Tax=Priestia filamentosa TaxID=1402861 RepID=A0A1X7DMH9_9BACI|nr:SDR family NAD(P)-dependent oxidoreductase [Priestia filamentosa]AKO93314.1 oxidoreductase [Priestia filamentosa]MDT3763476.1 SDR family NAD(P)-dependent oxidoreductase [Priestia filamentosa]OXS72026.1 oxidoreductase [Priestia filamentosa]RJS63387.1 NAD(P)-dependent oxidoreductase [Priestia filamentosa]WRU93917.1 SDR family NAD(P)-dependent oxidoreductase [Priestia filamentosa]